MRGRGLVAFALTLAMLAAAVPTLAPGGAAQADDVRSVDRSLDAAGDTVVFELSTSEGFDTLQGSSLTVTATFDDGTQRVARTSGLVHGGQGTSCGPCFTDLYARTMEDAAVSSDPEGNGDLRADTGPGVDVAVETGHDHDGFRKVGTTIDIGSATFSHAGTYHLYVTVPGADHIEAALDLSVRDPVTVGDGLVTDAGFAHWIDDMRAAGTHTMAANAYVGSDLVCGAGCGDVTVPVSGSQQVFAAIGPSQNGLYNAHVDPTGNYCEDCFGPIPATFVGQWGAQWPGDGRSGTGVGAVSGASPNEAVVAVPGASGDTTFFVSEYVSLGPQDLVASGFVDPS